MSTKKISSRSNLKPDIGSTSSLSRREGSLENKRTPIRARVSFYDDSLEKTPPHNFINLMTLNQREENNKLI
jgi:hypothetical protein